MDPDDITPAMKNTINKMIKKMGNRLNLPNLKYITTPMNGAQIRKVITDASNKVEDKIEKIKLIQKRYRGGATRSRLRKEEKEFEDHAANKIQKSLHKLYATRDLRREARDSVAQRRSEIGAKLQADAKAAMAVKNAAKEAKAVAAAAAAAEAETRRLEAEAAAAAEEKRLKDAADAEARRKALEEARRKAAAAAAEATAAAAAATKKTSPKKGTNHHQQKRPHQQQHQQHHQQQHQQQHQQ